MSYLYQVYAHPTRGQWGFTPAAVDGQVRTASVDANSGRVSVQSLPPIKVGAAISEHVRRGYQRVVQPKYLLSRMNDTGSTVGEFVSQHPDLGAALEGTRIYFAAIPDGTDMKAVAAHLRVQLDATEATPRTRDAWLHHCEVVTSYAPAMSNDIAAALVLAEWALGNRAILVPEGGTPPDRPPSSKPHQWREYLSQWASPDQVGEALEALGWPLSAAIALPARSAPTSTDAAESPGWLDLAQQVSF